MKINYGYWPALELPEERIKAAFKAMKRDVEEGRANYINLPFSRDHLSASLKLKEEMGPITDLVVCGMGGSSLGAKALLSAFGPADGLKIHILDTIEPDVVESLFSSLNLKSTLFNVITKSGRTLETLALLNVVLQKLETEGLNVRERLVITTTESDDNELYRWAVDSGIRTLPFPHGVEGRYSVLSSVGLFPALYMNCEPEGILRGAEAVAKQYFRENNEPLVFSSKSVSAMEAGISSHVLLPYSVYLKETGEWFAQLWAESLGKNGKGQLPAVAVGPAVQHSQLQLYLDGPKNIGLSILEVEGHDMDAEITNSVGPYNLAGKSLSDILGAEARATAVSLTEKRVFNRTLALGELNEREIGGLLAFLEMATAYAGYLMGVNPYDQPAVEEEKRHAREILGL